MARDLEAPFSVTMDSAAALRQRPTLAAAIGVIAGIWANIEHELGLIMASILGTDAALGIAIHLNLQSEWAQRKVLKTAAESRLSTENAAKIVSFAESLKDRTNITIKSSDIAAMANKPRLMIYEERDFTDISMQLEECLKEALWLHAYIAFE